VFWWMERRGHEGVATSCGWRVWVGGAAMGEQRGGVRYGGEGRMLTRGPCTESGGRGPSMVGSGCPVGPTTSGSKGG
jgi:hypothetical protein